MGRLVEKLRIICSTLPGTREADPYYGPFHNVISYIIDSLRDPGSFLCQALVTGARDGGTNIVISGSSLPVAADFAYVMSGPYRWQLCNAVNIAGHESGLHITTDGKDLTLYWLTK
jgi:hypothetical protein